MEAPDHGSEKEQIDFAQAVIDGMAKDDEERLAEVLFGRASALCG